MKRTRHLLLTATLLVSTFSLTAGTITSVSELSNTKLYHVSQPNHQSVATSWAVAEDGESLESNYTLGIAVDGEDTRQQFAFLSNNGGTTYYLYHAAEAKFVNRDGSLSESPVDAIRLMPGAYDNTFVAYFDCLHYINVGGQFGDNRIEINLWNTLDGGNSCVITAVGDLDPTELLETLPATTDIITYSFDLGTKQAEVTCLNDLSSSTITIPPTVTYDDVEYRVTSIGDYAFYGCSALNSVVSLSTVAPEMGTNVFGDIASDATLTIPPGSTSSYEDAGWTSYFASVVEMVGGNDGNITWMLTPDGELIIRGTGAMNDYTRYTDVPWHEHRSSITKVTIEEGVTNIGRNAFNYCSSLTSITIPRGVTSIGSDAFSNCFNLTFVDIPESVTSIGEYAFSYCSSLLSIMIPESVTSIGYDAFSYCDNLISIVVAEGNTVYDSREGCNAIIETNTNTLVLGCSITIIPNTVMNIGGSAFCGYRSLVSISIPKNVTSIGGNAFAD